jgi:hypothetical protein
MTRPRRALSLILVAVLLSACESIDTPTPISPSPAPSPTPRPTSRVIAGCAASGGPSGVGCGVLPSFGDSAADRDMALEIPYQAAFWTSAARVMVLNDCDGQNAYSDPAGYIFYGRSLFWGLRARGADLAIIGVLAHEYGHQIQFRFGWQTTPARPMELEADAMAGFYLGVAKAWTWQLTGSFFQNTFAMGDTLFNSPSHHGTPEERLAAARLGYDTGVYSLVNRRQFSWYELHYIFASAIRGGGGLAQPLDSEAWPTDLRGVGAALERSEFPDIARGTTRGSETVSIRLDSTARRALFPR